MPIKLSTVAIVLVIIGVPVFIYDPDIGVIPLWFAAMVGVVMVVRAFAEAGARLKARAERDRE